MTENSKANNSSSGANIFSGSAIKYIAIIAMAIDHYAWLFVPTQSFLGQFLHFIGRTTAPVMAFFITEGFHYTKDVRKYFIRLGIFAFISQFAYNYYNTGRFLGFYKFSVITSLMLGLTVLCLYRSEKIPVYIKLPIFLLILSVSRKCDWGESIVWIVLAFEITRGDKLHQLVSYGGTVLIFKLAPLMYDALKEPSLIANNWMKFGMLLPIPLLMLYSGKRGGGKFSKWVFYVFYPLHLVIIAYIRFRTR